MRYEEILVQHFNDGNIDKVNELKDKVDWMVISRYVQISEPFMRTFQDELDWFFLSRNHTLSYNFMREFQDKINWPMISMRQKLNEPFIREFQSKVKWGYIVRNQKLSHNFLIEFGEIYDLELSNPEVTKFQKLGISFLETVLAIKEQELKRLEKEMDKKV